MIGPDTPWTFTRVEGTRSEDRPRLHRPYVIVLDSRRRPPIWKRPRLVLVRRKGPADVVAEARQATLARVRWRKDSGEDVIRMDQTLRTALGLQGVMAHGASVDGDDVEAFPIHVSRLHQLLGVLSALIGHRYLLLRVAPARPPDIEKPICRISADDLAAMGAKVGSRVVLFGVDITKGQKAKLVRHSIQALELVGQHVDKRKEAEEKQAPQGRSARYPSATEILGIDGLDLNYIFLDDKARRSVHTLSVQPVLVRRNAWSALIQDVQGFGVVLLAGVLAIDGITKLNWAGVLIAIALAAMVSISRLRNEIG